MPVLTLSDLQRYDDNIREHLAAMNEGRPEPITLRYFQYLASPLHRNLLGLALQPGR